jgi:hypothetical protein
MNEMLSAASDIHSHQKSPGIATGALRMKLDLFIG